MRGLVELEAGKRVLSPRVAEAARGRGDVV